MAYFPQNLIKATIDVGGIVYEVSGYGSLDIVPGRGVSLVMEKMTDGVITTKPNDAFSPLYYNTPHVHGGICDYNHWFDTEQFKREYLNTPQVALTENMIHDGVDAIRTNWVYYGDLPKHKLWEETKEQEKEMDTIDLNKVALRETIEARLRIMAYHDMHHYHVDKDPISAGGLSAQYVAHSMTPCSKCNGLRAVVSENNDPTYCNIYRCPRCNGTGVEPKPKTKIVPIDELTLDQLCKFLSSNEYKKTSNLIKESGLNEPLKTDMARAAVRNCAKYYGILLPNDSVEIPNE